MKHTNPLDVTTTHQGAKAMEFKNVKAVFDYHVKAKIDDRLASDMFQYVQEFLNKDDVTTMMWGSALVGVYPVRFVTSDSTRFLEDILLIEDIRDCQEDILSLKDMNRDFKVATDITNLAFMYLLHRLMTSNINKRIKEQVCIYTVVIAIAKHLTSLLTRRFRFNANPEIAQALLEHLDDRTDLKYYGSWLNLLLARGKQMVEKDKKNIFYETIMNFDDDIKIIYMTGEIRNRMRKTLNILTEKFHELKDAQGRILSKSALTEIDGSVVMKEYSRKESALILDMETIAKDPRNLIKDDLVELTTEVISTSEVRYLKEVLDYYTDNFSSDDSLQAAQQALIVFVLNEAKHSRIELSDITSVIGRIRSIFRSSRAKNTDVVILKRTFAALIETALPRARDSVKVATSISLVVYIVLRLLTIPKYRI